tara:strand:- start:548 stop:649 length:102 start_codon:yes stop_codon:yes gene_type:complete
VEVVDLTLTIQVVEEEVGLEKLKLQQLLIQLVL